MNNKDWLAVRRVNRTVEAIKCSCSPTSPDDCIVICISGTMDLNEGAAASVAELNSIYRANNPVTTY